MTGRGCSDPAAAAEITIMREHQRPCGGSFLLNRRRVRARRCVGFRLHRGFRLGIGVWLCIGVSCFAAATSPAFAADPSASSPEPRDAPPEEPAAALQTEAPSPGPPSHQQTMAAMGFVRHSGSWRTAQEIELIDRAERAATAQREWNKRLERLRRDLDTPRDSGRAVEEIRGITDPFAVSALAAALAKEPQVRVRALYVEALSRVRSQEAFATLVSICLDHPDPETRIAAVERIAIIGPQLAAPSLAAALSSADNAQVNRAAEALGRLGLPSVVAALINSLETEHVVTAGTGKADGATSVTFTPSGGGLSMGGGPKRMKVRARNDRVLEALVALTGVNFEWDGAAWRAWLANREAPPPDFDPRRG